MGRRSALNEILRAARHSPGVARHGIRTALYRAGGFTSRRKFLSGLKDLWIRFKTDVRPPSCESTEGDSPRPSSPRRARWGPQPADSHLAVQPGFRHFDESFLRGGNLSNHGSTAHSNI